MGNSFRQFITDKCSLKKRKKCSNSIASDAVSIFYVLNIVLYFCYISFKFYLINFIELLKNVCFSMEYFVFSFLFLSLCICICVLLVTIKLLIHQISFSLFSFLKYNLKKSISSQLFFVVVVLYYLLYFGYTFQICSTHDWCGAHHQTKNKIETIFFLFITKQIYIILLP